VGLSVFGFQQSALWGWSNPAIWASIAAGLVLLVVFFMVERRTESPLINVRIFENRTFTVENIILGVAMMAFIPVFFFAAIYGQIALAEKATTASLLILYFFLGFVVCAQIGGRMLDRIGAKRPVVLGSALAAVGFGLWASKATDLHVGAQVIWIVMAGAGMGLMLGQANTDAINRASRYSYGEATGITQTVRNYGASLGFAILGTLLITRFRSAITSSLTGKGLPAPLRRRRRPRSPSCGAAAATPPPSRRSSAPTSPPPPATCSTAWPSPPWWPCAASGAASRKTPHRRRSSSAASCPVRTRTPTSTPPGANPYHRLPAARP
jgi:Major Facilitator Superfamily